MSSADGFHAWLVYPCELFVTCRSRRRGHPLTHGGFAKRPHPARSVSRADRSAGLNRALVLFKGGSKAIPCVGRVDARTIAPLDREMRADHTMRARKDGPAPRLLRIAMCCGGKRYSGRYCGVRSCALACWLALCRASWSGSSAGFSRSETRILNSTSAGASNWGHKATRSIPRIPIQYRLITRCKIYAIRGYTGTIASHRMRQAEACAQSSSCTVRH